MQGAHCEFQVLFFYDYRYLDLGSGDNFDIDPIVLTRITPASPFQFDFGVMGSYQKLVWLGFTYKHQYAVGTSVGGIINKKLYAGISYDIVINDLASYGGTSTEVLVGYIFGSSSKDIRLEGELNF